MRQTLAIFLDAYRELNSRKLFWISLSMSLAVVIALALPTQTDKGFTIFGAKVEIPPTALLSAKAISASAFYKFIYSWIGINLWLGWGATILALISTASMIPEMISSGSIELTLAKPIGRLRLFLTRYTAGLLFVGLQAAVFAIGAILVIGARGSVWDARPLLIIPIMIVFFSFLHCMSVLVGMVTRSTLMALLAVLLIWLFIWALGAVENVFLQQKAQGERNVERIVQQQDAMKAALAAVDGQIARLSSKEPEAPKPATEPETDSKKPAEGAAPAATPTTDLQQPESRRGRPRDVRRSTNRLLEAGQRMLDAATDTNLESLRTRRTSMQSQLDVLDRQWKEDDESLTTTRKVHWWLYGAFTVFPKTGETKDLFQRWVIDKSDWQGFMKMLDQISGGDGSAGQEAMNNRPLWWILGTSLGFEFVILAIAAIIFVRRDF